MSQNVRQMGKLFFVPGLCILMLILSASSRNGDGEKMTITKYGTPCSVWGVVINGYTYPADDIPPAFRKEGVVVYANYEFYEDMRPGACSGGTWTKITSMREQGSGD